MKESKNSRERYLWNQYAWNLRQYHLGEMHCIAWALQKRCKQAIEPHASEAEMCQHKRLADLWLDHLWHAWQNNICSATQSFNARLPNIGDEYKPGRYDDWLQKIDRSLEIEAFFVRVLGLLPPSDQNKVYIRLEHANDRFNELCAIWSRYTRPVVPWGLGGVYDEQNGRLRARTELEVATFQALFIDEQEARIHKIGSDWTVDRSYLDKV